VCAHDGLKPLGVLFDRGLNRHSGVHIGVKINRGLCPGYVRSIILADCKDRHQCRALPFRHYRRARGDPKTPAKERDFHRMFG
jgi:hypothetical protein